MWSHRDVCMIEPCIMPFDKLQPLWFQQAVKNMANVLAPTRAMGAGGYQDADSAGSRSLRQEPHLDQVGQDAPAGGGAGGVVDDDRQRA